MVDAPELTLAPDQGAPGTGMPPDLVPAPTQFTLQPPPPTPSASDSVVNGSLTDPAKAAKALTVAPKTNVPSAVVVHDPEGYQRDSDLKDALDVTNSNPNIQNYVQKDPLNASVSMGKFDTLDQASKSISQLEVERVSNMTFGRLLLEAAKNSPAGLFYGISSKSARLFSQGFMTSAGAAVEGIGAFMALHPVPVEGTEMGAQPFESPMKPAAPSLSPITRIGQGIEGIGMKIPTTQEERESFTGQVESGAGGVAPYIAATLINPALGVGLGFVGMGATSYNETYKAAIQAGASEEDARSAANWNGAIGGVLGALPLKSEALVKSTLAKIAVSGATFATLGEAQHFATTVIAKEYYNPNSTYDWDTKRALASFVLGAGVGGGHALAENATQERQKGLITRELLAQGKAQAEVDAIIKDAQSDVEFQTMNKALADFNEAGVKEMSDKAAEDFAESHTGLLGSVMIPAYRVREIYDAEGKVPGRNDGLFGWIPDLANKMDLATDSGSEIKDSD